MTTPVAPAAPVATPAPAAPNGAAPANGTPPPAAAPEPKFKLTVDGAEREFSRAELQKFVGKQAFADRLIQQAKDALKKTSEARAKDAEDAPTLDDDEKLEAWLAKRGAKPETLDKLARRRLEQRVKAEELTPEQRAAQEAAKRAEAAEAKLKERETADQKAKQAAAEAHLQKQMESQLADVAEKAGLGRDLDAFDALRAVVREWVEMEYPWDPVRIVEEATERLNGAISKLQKEGLGRMDGKALHEFLGKDALKKLNEYQLSLIRNGGAVRVAPTTPPPVKPAVPGEHISPQDLENKYRGGYR